MKLQNIVPQNQEVVGDGFGRPLPSARGGGTSRGTASIFDVSFIDKALRPRAQGRVAPDKAYDKVDLRRFTA